jgi:hypothetical protein
MRLGEAAIWVGGIPLVGGLSFLWLASERPDWAGHFLAGYGATLLVCWIVARARGGRPRAVFLTSLVSIGLGAGLEASVFRLAFFDFLDFWSQSLGASLAALSVVVTGAGDEELDWPDPDALLARNSLGRLILAASGLSLLFGFLYAVG